MPERIPNHPSPEMIPQATPDMLAGTIEAAFAHYENAVEYDQHDRPSLTIYIDEEHPDRRITMQPTWGSTDVHEGTISIDSHSRAGTQHFILNRAGGGTRSSVNRLTASDIPGASEPTMVNEFVVGNLQRLIVDGSPERPAGQARRFARRIGHLSSRNR